MMDASPAHTQGLFVSPGAGVRFVDIVSAKTYILPKVVPEHMSARQSYIVRLLRKLEISLVEHHLHLESEMLGKVIYRISRAEKIEEGLETLYCVQGFDLFALRLMWSLKRFGIETKDLASEVEAYELAELGRLMKAGLNGSSVTPATTTTPISGNQSDELNDALHRYGRCIEDLKRKSNNGETFCAIDKDILYKLLNEAGLLIDAARNAVKSDVQEFGAVASRFIQFVIDNRLFDDIRVVHLLDNANITLQTVLDGAGPEDYDSLQQTIELLQNPHTVLD